ncbi:OB-fold putative lipoprotein [Nocardioides sp. SR21]|uniref:OB-fold putative lipoprotein n=1 Tax=Nocardioides sp. SR21 TaxID=2919501 RepID=UPI001FA962D2|nr:OB-fold putative lipoprotein [Nocardioides sp. SR21]
MSNATIPEPTYKDAKAQAKAAKAYAKAQRPFYKKKRVILPAATAAVIGIAAVSSGGGSSDPSESAVDKAVAASHAKGGEAKADAPKPVSVDADVILKEFEENEAAADAKYDGKVLKVTGVVASIDTELFDDSEYVINIGTGSDWDVWTVNADDQAQDAVASLKKGDDITVIGEFEDGGDLGVELAHAEIVG